jgi:hypothetical protein
MSWRKHFCAQLGAALAAALTATTANAGVLNDWFGVFPKLDLANGRLDTKQNPDATSYHFLNGSLLPTRHTNTVNYVIDDWWGAWNNTQLNDYTSWSYTGQGAGMRPSGEEPYDVEALYFDNDTNNFYIAIITSFPRPLGIIESRASNILVPSGDLALDFGGKGHNSPTASPDSFRYDFGVNINTEIRPSSGNVTTNYSSGLQPTNGFYKTYNNDWYLGTPSGAVTADGELTNFDPNWASFGGQKLGDAEVTYRKLYFYSDNTASWTFDPFKTEVKEGVYDTFAIEITIATNLFTLSQPLADGDPIRLSWVEGCRNDANGSLAIVRLTGTTNIVPEPGVASLLIAGGALVWMTQRRRRACRA